VKLTTHRPLALRAKMVELYLHSLIRLHDIGFRIYGHDRSLGIVRPRTQATEFFRAM
jgi:hypothetical protein